MSTTTAQRPTTTGALVRHDHSAGLLLLRVVLGIIFIGHGAQKLFGWFGGAGLDGTAKFFASAGYQPGHLFAVLGGLAEFGGGVLLILGLGTSFAGAALVADMLGATSTVATMSNGAFFAQKHGYEYEIVLAMAALAITLLGAGRFALDSGRAWDRPHVRWAFAVLGVIAGVITMLVF